MYPIVFDVDKAGNEVCRMADHMVIQGLRMRFLSPAAA